MNVIDSVRPRVALVFALLSGLMLLPGSQPAIGSAGSYDVDVTVQVEEPQPACAGSEFPISFLPLLDYSSPNNPIYIELPDTISDYATIDLAIMEGQDADCNLISGYVTFTESGFIDLDDESSVSFLGSEFECGNSLLTPVNGVFTCDPAVASAPVITMTVEAGDGARQGYFENTISLVLFANP